MDLGLLVLVCLDLSLNCAYYSKKHVVVIDRGLLIIFCLTVKNPLRTHCCSFVSMVRE